MIIWGWRTLKGTEKTGQFHCPHCSSQQPYAHETLRRWFTLYHFLPVIPLGSLDEQITCGKCRKSWMMSVLDNDPQKLKAAQMSRIARNWIATMAAVAVSRGGPSMEVAQLIVTDLETATGQSVRTADVHEAAAGIAKPVTDETVVGKLGSLPDDLSSTGLERLLVSMLNVLRKLTNCGPAEIAMVRKVGASLGISQAHVKGILLDAGLQAE